MKISKRIASIIQGIPDGVLPAIKPSISTDDFARKKVNWTRLTVSVMSWLLLLGVISGKLSLEAALEFLKVLLTGGVL